MYGLSPEHDRPFGSTVVEIVLDLPFPPSTNAIWRSNRGRVHRSVAYVRWTEAADMAVMAAKQYPKRKITGPFEAHIVLRPTRAGRDLDNLLKAPIDWAQSRDLIRNDSDCQKLTAEWGDIERGCRLTLREIATRPEPLLAGVAQ